MNRRRKDGYIYLEDYRPPNYLIPEVNLEFDIFDSYVSVVSEMKVVKNHDGNEPLILDGENLKLESVEYNGELLHDNRFTVDDKSITIYDVDDKFVLRTEVKIDPFNNTTLMGFYRSGDILCSQNEPEGFRRITYFIDRPDVMSIFRTKIKGDKNRYKYMLSNGNKLDYGDIDDNRHFVVWKDPFPKPCYLFAIVAGDFDLLKDSFTTKSGRKINLEIYVDKGKLERVRYAMNSLKRAMEWDENRFDLECDLDEYKIVAVSSFNMGAMENKGLNIFNISCIMGDHTTATDRKLKRVESVIGHEYFHNWTGNRVTCRDWFQLTLKEGLTVFRDHEFIYDRWDRAKSRIEDVRLLRSVQFPEDSGPLAHPIRPNRYKEIDNFYTSTVYEKGEEVIRMIQTFIGKDTFKSGLKRYLELYDGKAVTTDGFIFAMEQASGKDLTQFKNWYNYAGTPRCHVKGYYNRNEKEYKLVVEQSQAPNIKDEQPPFMFPLKVALFYKDGRMVDLDGKGTYEITLEISKRRESFIFNNIEDEVIPSLLRDFSAPLILNYDYSIEDLISLLRYDNDSFNRYEASQRLIMYVISSIFYKRLSSIPKSIFNAFQEVLENRTISKELIAEILTLPELNVILESLDSFDVDRAFEIREMIFNSFAKRYEPIFYRTYCDLVDNKYSMSMEAISRRSLKNIALNYLTATKDSKYIELAYRQFLNSDNMTDTLGALTALNNIENSRLKGDAFKKFYDKWHSDELVINSYFALYASRKYGDVADTIEKLSQDPAFDSNNPNKVYALYVTFANNLKHFHDPTGKGYRLIGKKIVEFDKRNPHISSKLAKTFKKYPVLDINRKKIVKEVLEEILSNKDISKGLSEVLELILYS